MIKTPAQRAKEWRKKNPDKVIAYARMRTIRDKEKIKKYSKKYYSENTDKIKEYHYNGQRKKDNLIRVLTNDRNPIKDKKCVICSNKAEERHHTTKPMQIDYFIFVCHNCHRKIHRGEIKGASLTSKEKVK